MTAPVLLMQADHDAIFVPVDDSALFSSSPDVRFTLLHFTGHKIFEHPAAHALAVLDIALWIGAALLTRAQIQARLRRMMAPLRMPGEADPAEIRRHQYTATDGRASPRS